MTASSYKAFFDRRDLNLVVCLHKPMPSSIWTILPIRERTFSWSTCEHGQCLDTSYGETTTHSRLRLLPTRFVIRYFDNAIGNPVVLRSVPIPDPIEEFSSRKLRDALVAEVHEYRKYQYPGAFFGEEDNRAFLVEEKHSFGFILRGNKAILPPSEVAQSHINQHYGEYFLHEDIDYSATVRSDHVGIAEEKIIKWARFSVTV